MVVEEGGFDRAGKRLHLTQSAVSQRVKQLEEQAGQIMLVRATPPVPTDAGRQVIRHLRKVQRLEADLRDDLQLSGSETFTSLPIGVNADSLSTWFIDAIRPFLEKENALIDLTVDDQDQTHRQLREGRVLACVSTESKPLQGCRVEYLGCMKYRLMASRKFSERWFPDGFSRDAARKAPAILFTRHDTLHQQLLAKIFEENTPWPSSVHYLPDYVQFAAMITGGLAYGTLTSHQSDALLAQDKVIDLAPGKEQDVHLYWHTWTIQSRLLKRLSVQILQGADAILGGG